MERAGHEMARGNQSNSDSFSSIHATHRHSSQEWDLANHKERAVDVCEGCQDDPEADVHEASHDLDGLRE